MDKTYTGVVLMSLTVEDEQGVFFKTQHVFYSHLILRSDCKAGH